MMRGKRVSIQTYNCWTYSSVVHIAHIAHVYYYFLDEEEARV